MTSFPDPPDSPRRPTPVRVLMAQEAAEQIAVDRESEQRESTGQGRYEAATRPPRVIEVDGAEWTVIAAGSTRTGAGSDHGAPLLLVRFERSGAGSEVAAREALAVTASLDGLSDDALVELMLRARPSLCR